ncbi:MAG: ribosome maturation factor RimP [Pseudomonadota bacterium]|nr:MAG: ribosome maturation factor RimP [Pseudomonadota bacterium]
MGREFSHGLRATLRQMLAPGAKAHGCELVDVEMVGGGRRPTLRVYIDKPGGVTLDDCADVSRQLSMILDVEDPIPESYALEVSSPGLDRPLVTREDFGQHAGETIKARLTVPRAGRRNFTGRIVGVTAEQVTLEIEGLGGTQERVDLKFESIERARLVPQFGGQRARKHG